MESAFVIALATAHGAADETTPPSFGTIATTISGEQHGTLARAGAASSQGWLTPRARAMDGARCALVRAEARTVGGNVIARTGASAWNRKRARLAFGVQSAPRS